MLRTIALLAFMALAATHALAQETPPQPEPVPVPAEPVDDGSLKVGDDAPDFTPRNWINPPAWESFSELKGDVILLKAWGINCVPCMRQLPHMNELNATPGLHVVGLYAQIHTLEEIEAVVEKHEIEYPLTADGDLFNNAGYVTDGITLPHVWIIGVEGKIVFAGMAGYSEALEAELAKVKYPGLGKASVHKELEPAAKAFVEGKYAEAYKLAEAVSESTEDEKAEEDADYIVELIDDRLGTLSVRAETAEIMKDYGLALACWEELATKYKGLEDAAEAPERLKKLQDDKAVAKENTARRALFSLMLSLDVSFQEVDVADATAVTAFRKKCMEAYAKFAAENKDTAAASTAKDLVTVFKDLIPEEPTPEEPKK